MAATRATSYMADRRTEHFWDLWSFALNAYTKLLDYPGTETAWDVFLVYKPHLRWKDKPPEPTSWLQAHGLDIGLEYTPGLLEQELGKWIK
jgi:hypothetical protein